MASWSFRKKSPSEKSRNPMQDEFFAAGSECGAIVRESIQNSLDACLNQDKPVRVRFYFSNKPNQKNIDEWFDSEAWRHFKANGNGLRDIPSKDSNCSLLVYEDFNTKGLNGDILQNAEIEKEKNSFYYFLRAEGQSDKIGNELGSWGVGKIVFPRSSKLRAIFVLTVRSEDAKKYLAGQSTLKYHTVDNQVFSPDGWYGEIGENGMGLPIDDPNTIERFSTTFNLTRTNEPGFSVLVPWVDENITFEGLIRAAIEEYFFAVLKNKLEILIETDDGVSVSLTRDTLLNETEKWDTSNEKALSRLVELAETLVTQPSEQIILLPKYTGNKPEWQPQMIQGEVAVKIFDCLEADVPVVIRVPMTIHHKKNSGIVEDTYFDVIIRKWKESNLKPIFLRDGLVITDVRRPKNPGYLSLVQISDKPLKTLLGQAENPAHTQWNEGSDHYKGKYIYEGQYLNFLRFSVKRIIQYIQKNDNEADPTILADMFSMPRPGQTKTKQLKPEQTPGPKVEHPSVPPLEPKESYYRLEKLNNGFKVTGRKEHFQEREYLITMAYDVLRGDPFRKWYKADFVTSELTIDCHDAKIMETNDNHIKFHASSNSFIVKVVGFDANRDLKVKVESKDSDNA